MLIIRQLLLCLRRGLKQKNRLENARLLTVVRALGKAVLQRYSVFSLPVCEVCGQVF